MIKNIKVLIVDLETSSPNVDTADIRVFGALDYNTLNDPSPKFFIWRWDDKHMAEAIELMLEYDYIITYNGKMFDFPLLKKFGVPVEQFKHIDLLPIIRTVRNSVLNVSFKNFQLRQVCKDLSLDECGKGDIDYKIFQHDSWSVEEQALIVKYLKQDLIVEAKLWKYLEETFEPYKALLLDKDIQKCNHIVSNLDNYTYKALCKVAGIQEWYDEKPKITEVNKPYISRPRKAELQGPISIIYIKNLYSSTISQFNLLSSSCNCCGPQTEGKYHGKNFYNIEGYYCQKTIHPIGKTLIELNTEMPGIDPKVLDLVNSRVFNVLCNPKYINCYNNKAVVDCTHLVKFQLKYITEQLVKRGYFVVFIDTDKIFVKIDVSKGESNNNLENDIESITSFLRSRMPFPNKTFKTVYTHNIKLIKFLAENNTPFPLNHQYLYVLENNFVNAKNLCMEQVKEMLKR